MPRAFDITAATDSVRLDASGQGELAFTVSNALRVPMRARASVQVSGGARPEWTSIPGGEERDFAADGTQQLTVRFQVPKGTAPGRYTLQLLVVDVSNPDERYAQGPTVSFVVPEATLPAKKPFPWMWVALAAGVVLLVGVVVAVLAGRGGPGLGEPCGEGGDCGKGLACSAETGGVCLGAVGFDKCERDAHCLTGRCRDSTCEQVPPGETRCTSDANCPEQQKCVQVLNTRTCLLEPGTSCQRDLDCSSLYCREGTCTRDDGRCEENTDCKPPSQCTESKLCLLPNGEQCSENEVCMSGFCVSGRCAPSPAPPRCDPPCPPFSRCIRGRCVFIKPRTNQDLIIQQQPQLQQQLRERLQR